MPDKIIPFSNIVLGSLSESEQKVLEKAYRLTLLTAVTVYYQVSEELPAVDPQGVSVREALIGKLKSDNRPERIINWVIECLDWFSPDLIKFIDDRGGIDVVNFDNIIAIVDAYLETKRTES